MFNDIAVKSLWTVINVRLEVWLVGRVGRAAMLRGEADALTLRARAHIVTKQSDRQVHE